MIKYILHGGETGVDNEHNKAFYNEWIKDFDEGYIPNILLVYFAREDSELEYLEKSDIERFNKYTGNHPANFIVANSDIETFKGQISEADIIYVRGGSSNKLMEALKPIKSELLGMIDKKVFAGSSAGVMFLSHATRSNNTGWKEGFGLIPFNSIVHWSEDMKNDLDSYKEKHSENRYEYLLIPETQFIIKDL